MVGLSLVIVQYRRQHHHIIHEDNVENFDEGLNDIQD
jgi:hypothetical protein